MEQGTTDFLQVVLKSAPYVTVAKDILTPIIAIAAACIAWCGLAAWKKQLKGKTDYELARRLLRATYKVRNAIVGFRTSLFTDTEVENAEKEAGLAVSATGPGTPAHRQREAESKRAVYKARWARLDAPMLEWEAELLEAEVSWGIEVRQQALPLKTCVFELAIAVQRHLGRFGEDGVPLSDAERQKVEATLWKEIVRPEEDEYGKHLTSAVEGIEKLLKPNLKLR